MYINIIFTLGIYLVCKNTYAFKMIYLFSHFNLFKKFCVKAFYIQKIFCKQKKPKKSYVRINSQLILKRVIKRLYLCI